MVLAPLICEAWFTTEAATALVEPSLNASPPKYRVARARAPTRAIEITVIMSENIRFGLQIS
ncbi:hypothetical protein D3C84_1202380 [compost metagenome]